MPSTRSTRGCSGVVKVVHIHKITGIGGSELHLLTLLPALRARGMDARFLGLDVRAPTRRRFYALSTRSAYPPNVRCTRRPEPPHGGRHVMAPGAAALAAPHPPGARGHLRRDCSENHGGVRLLRHNDDRYLLGPFRTSTGASRIGRGKSSRSPMRFASSWRRRVPPREAPDHPLRAGRAPAGALRAAAGRTRDRAHPPLMLAIGRLIAQKDHPTLLRAFARIVPSIPARCL